MNAFDKVAGYAALKDELERCCAFVKRLTAENRLFLEDLTRALLHKAVITGEEVRALARPMRSEKLLRRRGGDGII